MWGDANFCNGAAKIMRKVREGRKNYVTERGEREKKKSDFH